MDFEQLLRIVGDEPVFETSLLLAGGVDPRHVRRQLSRWVRAGRLYQLRRGLYALAPPYQKVKPHPFLIANHLTRGSYVSLQSALAHYGLIPEHVPTVTSVTTARPGRWETSLGVFEFRHLKPALFFGYRRLDLGEGQAGFVATPEKALLDLIYLTPGGDTPEYLRELRLQNLDRLDLDALRRMAVRFDRPKMTRAAERIVELARSEAEEYESV
ncbi:MAG TPA: hypothetical protein G4O00_09500 [Thermoflexia bacterium]|jgi:predicted transcriptional regulator of viral defense system|nr:hypothetical protein [Thermoflexia bacterium]